MKPYYEDSLATLFHADSFSPSTFDHILRSTEMLAGFTVVSDPPFDILGDCMSFMTSHARPVVFFAPKDAYFTGLLLMPHWGWQGLWLRDHSYEMVHFMTRDVPPPVSPPVWRYEREEGKKRKPLMLMREIISIVGPSAIIDPFVGTGTTLVAASLLGRKSIGVEISETLCELAARRLEAGE